MSFVTENVKREINSFFYYEEDINNGLDGVLGVSVTQPHIGKLIETKDAFIIVFIWHDRILTMDYHVNLHRA